MYEKIIKLYPELTAEDFHPYRGTILLQDDSDGKGAYIAKWEHPTLAKPTDEQLGIVPVEAPAEVVAEAPVEIPAETPTETPVETPAEPTQGV